MRGARRPAFGYAMALGAAALFGVNGTVVKVAHDDGLFAYRLAWLAETLDAPQLVGGALVLAAIGLAQTARDGSGRGLYKSRQTR